MILHGKHHLTSLIVESEHKRLLKIEAQPGLGILKYNKKRSLAKNFEKEYKLSAVDLQPSTDKTLNVN